MRNWKQKLLVVLFGLVLINPGIAVAQTNSLPQYRNVESSLKDYVCTPKSDGQDLPRCINKLYRFAIVAGALAMVFFLVWAGYYYIVGGEAGKAKGKGMFVNTLVGMALLLGSYTLLRFINPDLVAFKPVQPPIFHAENLPACGNVGFGVACVLSDGTTAIGNGSGGGTAFDVKVCPEGIKPIPQDIANRGGELACPTLIEALRQLRAITDAAGQDFHVADAYGQGHDSICHKQSGTCADIGPDGNKTSYDALCASVNKTGKFRILNESKQDTPNCGKFFQSRLSTGAHLHIILQNTPDDLQ